MQKKSICEVNVLTFEAHSVFQTVLQVLRSLHKVQRGTTLCSWRGTSSSKKSSVGCLSCSETSLLQPFAASVPLQQNRRSLQLPQRQKHPVCPLHTMKASQSHPSVVASFWVFILVVFRHL